MVWKVQVEVVALVLLLYVVVDVVEVVLNERVEV